MSVANIITGDCVASLDGLEPASVHACVTSPPYYGLRDYGHDAQIGLEESPAAYVEKIVDVFRSVRRVLRDDGTLWLNLGDSYAGSWGAQGRGGEMADRSVVSARQIEAHPKRATKTGSVAHLDGIKAKDLIGIPWTVALALRADGWFLRQDIVWSKPNPMPESIRDRCTKAHEYVFLLSKSPRYYYDADAIAEPVSSSTVSRLSQANISQQRGSDRVPGKEKPMRAVGSTVKRNKRSVWTVTTKPFRGAHFATFPIDLIEPCVLAGAPVGGTVLDPFAGSGTVGIASLRNGRDFVGLELNTEYADMARRRIASTAPSLYCEVEG